MNASIRPSGWLSVRVRPPVRTQEWLVKRLIRIMNSFNVFQWDLFRQPYKISLFCGLLFITWLFVSHISMIK